MIVEGPHSIAMAVVLVGTSLLLGMFLAWRKHR